MSQAIRKTCLMSYANNKGADQPAHPRSLISAFVVRCLDSVMSLVSVTKVSSPLLASVAEQASLSLTWSETPEDMFSHDEAHMFTIQENKYNNKGLQEIGKGTTVANTGVHSTHSNVIILVSLKQKKTLYVVYFK